VSTSHGLGVSIPWRTIPMPTI